ncbi:MAG: protein BatD [Gammaproteobacteria bacterium]|nr:protein BatD [Gammaproteobacteria bacterium]
MVILDIMKKTTSISILIIMLFNIAEAATITVSSDRSPVGLNESFALVFESDSSVDDEPDFSPLNKDFQVLSRNKNSSMNIINGKISSSTKWQLTVLARRSGKLIIPSISFGKDKSQASFINVTNAGRTGKSKARSEDVFIEVEVMPGNIYVQAQLIYTVRLFLSVATSNASLSEPGISGASAVIERLGEDSNFQTSRRGKRYNVVERRYAIYPQVSGDLTIEPVMFQGQISRNAFSLFDPFGPQPKTIVERSESFTLDVKPIPDGFSGSHWIPAQLLTLTESWSPNPPVFKVGEPITRTLTLNAAGQTASQLPELPAWVPDDFKQYPDQPTLNDSQTAKGITASRQEKVAIIPNKAGEFVLPEISVAWWNTATDKMEFANLPERRIQVAALSAPAEVAGPTAPELSRPSAGVESTEGSASIESITVQSDSSVRFWQIVSAALVLLWSLTLILWWRSRIKTSDSQSRDSENLSLKQAVKAIQLACHENNPEQLKSELLGWANLIWPERPAINLGEIAKRSSSDVAEQLNELNNFLYSQRKSNWEGQAFWRVFHDSQSTVRESKKVEAGKLEPLYRI